MNQALLSIENAVMARSDSDDLWIPQKKSFHKSDRDVESRQVTNEKSSIEDTSALLFFWDGKKVRRITDKRLKEEMTRIIANQL